MQLHAYSLAPHQTFEDLFLQLREALLHRPIVNVGEWQSQHKPEINMREMLHVAIEMPMPATADEAAQATGARMPWAEDHFKERVGGLPLNPSPSEAWWPFRDKSGDTTNAAHKSEGEAFSHTYPERMWPKRANQVQTDLAENDPMRDVEMGWLEPPNWGLRFEVGDLKDVVNQLVAHPMTRQAYLPIWFPEDTGAVHGKRVPCTLGYHFIIRDGKLDISYFMRSTDLLRHFQDDIYMAIRLAQWMVDKLNIVYGPEFGAEEPPDSYKLKVGDLIFHTANLHIFEQDSGMIEWWKKEGRSWF